MLYKEERGDMKKRICFLCMVLLVTCLVSMFSISYADEFDTNIVSINIGLTIRLQVQDMF